MPITRLPVAAGAFAALMLGASPTWATPMLTNLIVNPGAEASAGADFNSTAAPSGWTTTSNFSAVRYDVGGAIDLNTNDSQAVGGGGNYFAGGVGNALSSARQSISLLDLATSIDAGDVTAALSALIGGWSVQGDNIVVQALFFDGAAAQLGAITIGPATATARQNDSSLLDFSDNALVPVGTRSVDIVMTATRADGTYNDGYADNLSFVLRGGQSEPLPLPGTLALAGLGLAVVAARRAGRR